MTAYEVPLLFRQDGLVEIPSQYSELFVKEKTYRAILFLPEENINEESDWSNLTVNEFIEGYSDGDSIYDKL
ncbi:MAG: hypothetical protein HW421_1080 [Ignavibacteria bacterium]|nr:hypothetical protein [Ignavibacteria bacterium]